MPFEYLWDSGSSDLDAAKSDYSGGSGGFSIDPMAALSTAATLASAGLRASADSKATKAQADSIRANADATAESAKALDAQAQAAEFNRIVALQNRVLSLEQGAEAERRFRVQSQIGIGKIRAGYKGLTLDGSPQDVIEFSAANAELDALTIRHEYDLRALGFQNSATLDEFQAREARRSAGEVRRQAGIQRAQAGPVEDTGYQNVAAELFGAAGTILSNRARGKGQ